MKTIHAHFKRCILLSLWQLVHRSCYPVTLTAN